MELCPQGGNPAGYCIGSLKLTNSFGDINTTESLQKNRKHFASRRKGSQLLGADSFLDYTSILIHLFQILRERERERLAAQLQLQIQERISQEHRERVNQQTQQQGCSFNM